MRPQNSAWPKPLLYVAAASLSCVLFFYLSPPSLSPEAASKLPIIGALPGDLPGYWTRFILSFFLLGIAPAIIALLFGERPAALGLSFKVPLLKNPWFWLLVPLAAGIGALGALSPDLAVYYPYSRDLILKVRETGLAPFFLHFAAYALLYYLPWEFFFRGFLLFPLALEAERSLLSHNTTADGGKIVTSAVAALVFFQTIPSTMLHFGHPLSELLGAIPAGIAFGLLAWKTKSIIPGFILHAALGFGTDLFIVLSQGGYLT
jgi:membrane protease YdiL (CAAX protease family)